MNTRIFGISILLVVFLTTMSSLCYGGEIKLMFPIFETQERTSVQKGTYLGTLLKGRGGKPVYSEKGLSEFLKEFEKEKYIVDQIELWIQGKAKSDNVTRLFISIEGNGGCKVILKPRNSPQKK
jgi:hypothetical protein